MIEPFAGGASISLTAAVEDWADKVVFGELDPHVAVVWKVIFGRSEDDARWLCRQIKSFQMTRDEVVRRLALPARLNKEKAFRTILRNRSTTAEASWPPAQVSLRRARDGKGIGSRWYPATLIERIRTIREERAKVSFFAKDAFETIAQFKDRTDAVFFIDPPYTAGGKNAGSRLYSCNSIDHAKLFAAMSEIKGKFMLTYDDSADVRSLAERHGFAVNMVPMKSTHHTVHYELLITKAV